MDNNPVIPEHFGNNEQTNYIKRVSEVDQHLLDKAILDKIINWLPKLAELYPIKMPDFDSILCHLIGAISYYMWGSLENNIIIAILSKSIQSFKNYRTDYEKRWKHEHKISNFENDVLLMQQIMKQDYTKIHCNDYILKLFTFMLTNVLKRTIIILSNDEVIQAIYLPLLTDHTLCVKYPIILYENCRKFYPLLMDRHFVNAPAIPLFTNDSKNLHLPFLLPEEKNEQFICYSLQSYMVSGNSKKHVNSNQYFAKILPISKSSKSKSRENIVYEAKQCTTEGCDLFGIKENNWKCSKCIKKLLLNAVDIERIDPLEESEPTAPDYELLTLKLSEPNLEPGLDDIEKPSMMMVPCKHPNCPNLVSRYTAPYCYDHVNYEAHKTSSTNKKTNPTKILSKPDESNAEEPSLMLVQCKYLDCPNLVLHHTVPYCHKHIDLVTTSRGITTSQKILMSTGNETKSVNTIKIANVSEKFDEIMKESENRTKVAATLCLAATTGCTNFGNSKCFGYCNECYDLFLK